MNRPSLSPSIIIYLIKLLLIYLFLILLWRRILILIILPFRWKNIQCIFLLLKILIENTLLLQNLLILLLLITILYINLIGNTRCLSLYNLLFLYIFIDSLIYIWIWIFTSKKSSLCIYIHSFCWVEHSLLWCWTFTFCKMDYVFYCCISYICWNLRLLLLKNLLLLWSNSLFKLHILLHFLLFIRQYRMFTSRWLYQLIIITNKWSSRKVLWL